MEIKTRPQKSYLRTLILSEKIERIDDLQSLQEWFNQLLRDASVQVLIRRSDDRWLYIETDNPSLFLSIFIYKFI